jgi:outer membrane protein assembly factor BamB
VIAVIASGLDHNLYCLNRKDGKLLWKFTTGFEVDCSSAIVDGRVYVGSEDGFFYCLNLEDGSLVYKTERFGSMEGSFAAVDGRIYTGTEQGDLFCLDMSNGSTIWRARIGADSDSTPALQMDSVTQPQRMALSIVSDNQTVSSFGSIKRLAALQKTALDFGQAR